ncbi:MAG: hypothetical protein ACM33T_16110 [Solirubrobacterales bacterium]
MAGEAYAGGCSGEGAPWVRLACFEREAFTTPGPSARCLGLGTDQARLACFAAASPGTATPPPPSPPPPTQAPEARRSPDATQPPPAPASAPAPSPALSNWRFELGAEYAQGAYDGTFRFSSGSVRTRSVFGGTGGIAHAAVWRDRALGERWSLGGEYLHMQSKARADVSMPNGVSLYLSPLSGLGDVRLTTDMGFLDVAYRPRNGDTLRPYVGMGLGAGYGTLKATYGTNTDMIATRNSSIIGGLQAFGGVEIALTDHLYLSPQARLLYFTARPVGADHEYVDLGVGAALGWRF